MSSAAAQAASGQEAAVWARIAENAADANRVTLLQRLAAAEGADETALLADAADGQLDQHELFEAALIACGIHDADERLRRRQTVDRWAEEIRRTLPTGAAPRVVAERTLQFLHTQVLTGDYLLEASSVARAQDEGTYNCVSSAVLFNCLAERLGLRVSAVESPAHVASVVHLADEDLTVETTCPDWFRVCDQPRERRQLLAEKTGQDIASASEGPRRTLPAIGMTAIVYYNRGVDLLEERKFAEAIAANARAIHCDRANRAAQANLLAAINNWGLAVAEQDEHEAALRILEAGLVIDHDHELLRGNYLYVADGLLRRLRQQQRTEEVRALLERGSRQMPGESLWRG